MSTEQAKPDLLDESALVEIETRLGQWERGEVSKKTFPASWSNVAALCQTVRAAWATIRICEQAFELDEATKIPEVGNLNALQFRKAMDNLAKENTALREQLVQVREQELILTGQITRLAELAELRSDLIAAKVAHVDQLQSRLAQIEKDLTTTKQHRDDLIEELRRQP